MNLSEILLEKGIESFAAISVDSCLQGNGRLYAGLPQGCYAIFMLFPYFCRERNSRLAAFASVPDYHLFSKELFGCLEGYLKEKYEGVYARGFTDHSPLEERDGAAKCGLGIIGRHGLLITEKYSSFVCIGELICSLSEEQLSSEGIEVREQEVAYCENCGLCIKNCPGKCADGDKSSCISAISQKKGELSPQEVRALRQSGSIWGCDACQLSCPHTKRAIESGEIYTTIPFFTENNLLGDEEAVCRLSDEEYSRYTFSYRKRSVMQRNIDIIRGGG